MAEVRNLFTGSKMNKDLESFGRQDWCNIDYFSEFCNTLKNNYYIAKKLEEIYCNYIWCYLWMTALGNKIVHSALWPSIAALYCTFFIFYNTVVSLQRFFSKLSLSTYICFQQRKDFSSTEQSFQNVSIK